MRQVVTRRGTPCLLPVARWVELIANLAACLQALRALDKVFGSTTNAKGFKVINGAGVIQGDGINVTTIRHILQAVVGEGFSAENVAFGMGGGLLQRVNRCGCGCGVQLCWMSAAGGWFSADQGRRADTPLRYTNDQGS